MTPCTYWTGPHQQPCGQPAAYKVVRTCTHTHGGKHCLEHAALIRRLIEQGEVGCATCGQTVTGYTTLTA